jgi:hyperosmotically inducible periplasmic protein
MRGILWSIAGVLLGGGLLLAGEVSTFNAYVDSDLCARLMLGPITSARVECSQNTSKQGADPVVVRLKDNTVLGVNKTKLLKNLVSQLAEVSGEVKIKDGNMKLEAAKPIEATSIPQGNADRKLLDVRTYKTQAGPKVYEKVRHELAMMPYISEFDFISFTMVGYDVILSGWTVRITNRSEAFNRVKSIEGVENIVNNIDVLPMGRTDMQIRASARAALQRFLSRYFWGSGSDIKIVVKNGDIILLGTVATQADSDTANIQCKSVPFAFTVFNMLRVAGTEKKS